MNDPVTEVARANAVNDAIRIVAAELRPWMEGRLGVWPPDSRGSTAPYDPSYLGWVLQDRWLTHFSDAFGTDGHVPVAAFRHTRNRWAHHVPFGEVDVVHAIDSCRQILLAIGSPRAVELEVIKLRVRGPASNVATRQVPVQRAGPRASHRRMRSATFREEQWTRRFDSHVAPLNELVDELIEQRDGSWMPYIPPYHGGAEAEILLLYQDPGKMTSVVHGGSGFLGCENDDPSAQVVGECLDAAGLSPKRVTPWNAYPWFLPEQGGVTAGMINEGLEPLRQVLERMKLAHTVVSGGTKAHESWRRFAIRFPEAARELRHIPTFHTSGRGITNGGQQTKAEGVTHVVAAFHEASKTPSA